MTATDTPQTFKCPKCKAVIKLTEAMAGPIREAMQGEFDRQLASERQTIMNDAWRNAEKNANDAASAQLNLLQSGLTRALEATAEKEKKLAEAQAETARLLALERGLADARREIEMTIAKRVNEQAQIIRVQETRTAAAEAELKVSEKQVLIDSLTAKINELNTRAEQGDNRVAGEAQELVLEAALRARFPLDTIEPVAKGVYGGDCLQRVVGPTPGETAGLILWESKRTKNWEDKWLAKLRSDQRAAQAHIAVLVTQTMPKSVGAFELLEGVWVCRFDLALPVAAIIRTWLREITQSEQNILGYKTKAEALYAYMTGHVFKARMQAAVERFDEMADDLRKEQAATTRLWAKRQAQITGAVGEIAGFVGDVQGLAGKAVGEIEGLRLSE